MRQNLVTLKTGQNKQVKDTKEWTGHRTEEARGTLRKLHHSSKMASERLLLKQTTIDTWTLKEQLALASAVVRSEDQNWVSVAKRMKPFSEDGRPDDWFSQKNCAQQYNLLLAKFETPKRKRGDVPMTESEAILKKLTADRIEELSALVQLEADELRSLAEECQLLEDENLSEETLMKIQARVEAEEMIERRKEEDLKRKLQERDRKKQAIEDALKAQASSVPLKGAALAAVLQYAAKTQKATIAMENKKTDVIMSKAPITNGVQEPSSKSTESEQPVAQNQQCNSIVVEHGKENTGTVIEEKAKDPPELELDTIVDECEPLAEEEAVPLDEEKAVAQVPMKADIVIKEDKKEKELELAPESEAVIEDKVTSPEKKTVPLKEDKEDQEEKEDPKNGAYDEKIEEIENKDINIIEDIRVETSEKTETDESKSDKKTVLSIISNGKKSDSDKIAIPSPNIKKDEDPEAKIKTEDSGVKVSKVDEVAEKENGDKTNKSNSEGQKRSSKTRTAFLKDSRSILSTVRNHGSFEVLAKQLVLAASKEVSTSKSGLSMDAIESKIESGAIANPNDLLRDLSLLFLNVIMATTSTTEVT